MTSSVKDLVQLRSLFTDVEYFNKNWHYEGFMLSPEEGLAIPSWRMKEKMKTSGAALCVCLNIGTYPPDIVRPVPSAKLECWFDPFSMPKLKSLELIGNNLFQQYEKLQPKAKYRQCLDATSDDLMKVCMSLRKGARTDRLLFHYNGHGVPRPTENGEIWVFGKHYTHYMPTSIREVRSWLKDPAIYVFDCSSAGILIPHLTETGFFGDEVKYNEVGDSLHFDGADGDHFDNRDPAESLGSSTIVLAACEGDEILPMSPQYPADVFTSCLTTPIQMAVRWFILQNPYSMGDVSLEIADNILGKDNDRRTPRGELIWIFTAITDTIAWDVLPCTSFQKLFRQDLLVASLFRNFLLAKRVMKNLGCTSVSHPPLPDTSNHPLWQSWDLAVEKCIRQMQSMQSGALMLDGKNNLASPFFAMHLSAFENWLVSSSPSEKPSLLPIVLQVLLSQTHRIRALNLIFRYLSISPEAVNMALIVGIFPYLLKLLQSVTPEIRQIMVSIWSELIRDSKACTQFMQFLVSKDISVSPPQRCMATFVLAELCNGFTEGKEACLQRGLHRAIVSLFRNPPATYSDNEAGQLYLVNLWLCLCTAKLCEGYPDAKYIMIKEGVYVSLLSLMHDSHPLVRAAAALALGELFGSPLQSSQAISQYGLSPSTSFSNLNSQTGGSPLVTSGALTPRNAYPPAGNAGPQTYQTMYSSSGGHANSAGSSNSFFLSSPHSPSGTPVENSIPFDIKQFEITLVLKLLSRIRDSAVVFRRELVVAISKFIRLSPHIQSIELIVQYLNVSSKRESEDSEDKESEEYPMGKPSVVNSLQPPTISNNPSRTRSNSLITPEESHRLIEKLSLFIQSSPLYTDMLVSISNNGGQVNLASSHPPQQPSAGAGLNREDSSASLNAMGIDAGLRARAGTKTFTEASQTLAGLYVKLWSALRDILRKEPHPLVCQALSSISQVILAKSESDRIVRMNGTSRSTNLGLNNGGRPYSISPFTPLPPGDGKSRSNLPDYSKQHHEGESHGSQSSAVHDKYIPLFESIPALKSHIYDHCRILFKEVQRQQGAAINSDVQFLDPFSKEGYHDYFKQAKREEIKSTLFNIKELCKPFSNCDTSSLMLENGVLSPVEGNRKTLNRETAVVRDTEKYGSTSQGNFSLKFEQKAILNTENSEMTSMVLFHAYQDILAVSDGTGVDIWSLENGAKVMQVKNASNLRSTITPAKVTSMQWLNEANDALLLIGSDDGAVKVWRDSGSESAATLTSSGGAALASAFIALPDLIDIQRGSGLVSSWDQSAGTLVVGGNSPTIRQWDLEREACSRVFQTGFDTCTTAIAACTSNVNMLNGVSSMNKPVLCENPAKNNQYSWDFAGFADGSVAIFDERVANQGGRVLYSKEHKGWIVSAHLRPDIPEVVTGALSGTVKFWDIRTLRSYKTLEVHKSPLTALALHNYAPIIATGSHAQFIKIITLSGEQLGMIRYHDGFLGQRIGPVSCLAFHPYKMYMAAGATDNIVSIYAASS